MKGANGSAGAVSFFAVAGDYDRWTVITLDHASGSDADHAAVPAFAIDHNTVGFAQFWIAGNPFFNRAQDAALFLLAIGVEAIQFRGQLTGASFIFYAE